MEQPPIAYNPHSFKNEIIFNFLLQKSFLKIFNIVLYVEMLWIFVKNMLLIKFHLRKDSIFLSFLLFFYFSDIIGINKAYEKCKIFEANMWISNYSKFNS